MLLSNVSIMRAMEKGDIVIEPFHPMQLQTNSYDVRLGEYYYEPQDGVHVVDFGRPETLRALWGSARKAEDGKIIIPPGGIILAHTLEIIGGRNGYTAKMFTRSTLGRTGQDTVCGSAGLGDVGYINHWTMEIKNNLNIPVIQRVGMRVAQIAFFYVGETEMEYKGKYGQGHWSPEDMPPKNKFDWDFEYYAEIPLTKEAA